MGTAEESACDLALESDGEPESPIRTSTSVTSNDCQFRCARYVLVGLVACQTFNAAAVQKKSPRLTPLLANYLETPEQVYDLRAAEVAAFSR
jgi:hypothetical protein